MEVTIDVPTLLTYWWREAGSPSDEATYLADMFRAKTAIGMANAGQPDYRADCENACRDLTDWLSDPETSDLLPLSITHPTRPR